MIEIITKKTVNEKNLKLLYTFNDSIFIPSFPDSNEREDINDIIARIYSGWTECAIVIESNEVLGGIIIDTYAKIKSVEIIYIATSPEHRGEGIGKKLLEWVREDYSGWNIYLEVDIPNSSCPFSYTRKKIWEEWGAREIPIHYIQPPLSPGKECVSGMSLMILDKSEINASELIGFLKEFYAGLKASERDELKWMISEIEEKDNIIKL